MAVGEATTHQGRIQCHHRTGTATERGVGKGKLQLSLQTDDLVGLCLQAMLKCACMLTRLR